MLDLFLIYDYIHRQINLITIIHHLYNTYNINFKYFAAEIEIENSDDYNNIEKEAEKLKLDINKFNEERVCIPDPNIIFHKAYSIVDKLKDSNKLQLLQFLEIKLSQFSKLIKRDIETSELLESSKFTEKLVNTYESH